MGLSELGLSAAHERVYRALVADPGLTPDALAAVAGLAGHEVEAAILGLRDLQLVIEGNSPTGVTARRPGVALTELAERHTRTLTRRLHDVTEALAEINALEELARQQRASHAATDVGLVEVLHGRAAVQAKLDELAWDSHTSLDTITPGPLIKGPDLGSAVPRGANLVRSLRRGLRVRWILDRTTIDDADHRRGVIESLRAGAEVRVANHPLDRLLVVDAEVAVVPVDLRNREAGAVVVSQPALLTALQAAFERSWERASPVTLDGAGVDVSPDVDSAAQDGELLAALTAHATDEAAARDLAISVRHLRRRTARAFAALGARNRFHAGVLAQRYGLLDPAASGPDETSRTGHPDLPPDA